MTYPYGGKALTVAVFDAVTLGEDRTSIIVPLEGRTNVAFDIELAAGVFAFSAAGTIRVLAGNSPTLTEADALDVPQWPVTVAGKVKLELKTAYDYVGLFFNFSSGGATDTITASASAS